MYPVKSSFCRVLQSYYRELAACVLTIFTDVDSDAVDLLCDRGTPSGIIIC